MSIRGLLWRAGLQIYWRRQSKRELLGFQLVSSSDPFSPNCLDPALGPFFAVLPSSFSMKLASSRTSGEMWVEIFRWVVRGRREEEQK